MSGGLDGVVAIVTGASRGLGRAFALDLVEHGASVTIVARSADGLGETAAMVDRGHDAFEIVVGDVTDPRMAAHAVERTEDRFGPVDVLVNNAGTLKSGLVEAMSLDDWRQVFEVNVFGPVIWSRAVLPGMRARHRGRIINISSAGAFTQHPYGSAYCASKAALSQLSSCFAAEVALDGITVLAFGPEALTDMTRALFETHDLPPEQRSLFEAYFTADPQELLRHSIELFRFLVDGGADHLSGHYVGTQRRGFDTPAELAARRP